ncbi:hypothetical protein [Halobaculum roseum]|uniref:DUF8156 domain-containing protein n=1 Tax=Halobaculum roseum TaxID=2175149 RepID=A0ABD5MGE3_9EURY|nr:hypothetical protein [Halobaculum roseum]QZY02377.1 hypothetical protein K6T36_13920 [Halobaculum roseum]
MGRTTPTYRRFLDAYEDDWADYRRALRREHRGDFDRLFEGAAAHAHAAGLQNPPDALEAMYLSMLLAHQAEIRRLRDRLDAVESAGTDDTELAESSESADHAGSDT